MIETINGKDYYFEQVFVLLENKRGCWIPATKDGKLLSSRDRIVLEREMENRQDVEMMIVRHRSAYHQWFC